MPTLLRFDGYRVYTYSNEHRPEHVHVEKGEKWVVFLLNCPDGPITVREASRKMTSREASRVAERLLKELPGLCAEWSKP
jgi:hypothetical protein